jgi:hypothetical protein
VPIIGFNSSHFDLNFILKHLHKPEKGIKIKIIFGSLKNFKASTIENDTIKKWNTETKMDIYENGENVFGGENDDENDDENNDKNNDKNDLENENKNNDKIVLKFVDLLNFVILSSLENVVKDFVDKINYNKNDLKGVFAYETFDNTNYNEKSGKSEPFTKD